MTVSEYSPEAVLAQLREILRMEYPSVKYAKEVAKKAIICIESLQKEDTAEAPTKEANDPAEAEYLEQLRATPRPDENLISRGYELLKRRFLLRGFTTDMGARELKDMLLAAGRDSGDIDDRSTKGGKGEPDPRIRVMIQEHGFCPHCKEEVTLPGILDIGNFPDDAEEKGYYMNWMGTKHRANFEKA